MSKGCNNCFLTSKFPGIEFNKHGLCNYCSNLSKKRSTCSSFEELKRIADNMKRESAQHNRRFDCVIGASGGIDSSYIIYTAVKKLNLTPLVVNYQSGCNNDIATENLTRICSKLGIELRIIKSEKANDRMFIKYRIKALKNIGLFWGICSFCHYCLKAVIYREALKENINVKLRAYSTYEDEMHITRKTKIFAVLRKFTRCSPLNIIQFAFYWIISSYYLLKLRLEFFIPGKSSIIRNEVQKPDKWKEIDIARYVEWDIGTMVRQLSEEFNWKYPKNTMFPFRFDCRIESLIDYTFKKVAGITARGLICNSLLVHNAYPKPYLVKAFEIMENENTIRAKINDLGRHLGIKETIV